MRIKKKYKLQNNGGSRDVFVRGQKYYFARDGSLISSDSKLIAAVKKLPFFKISEVTE